MQEEKKSIKVFYSWQSNTEARENRYFIRNALINALKHLNENQTTFIYHMDQATDNTPGSPDISATIIEKISTSQILISDVTIIPESLVPNPNVMFELGFAVAKIGWGRIISLMNTNNEHSPKDLPFDINKQRVSQYNSNEEGGKKSLEKLLIVAIETITSKNPAYPQESDIAVKENKKRQSDINNLTNLMNYLDTNLLDNYFNYLPNIMLFDGFTCWESFKATLRSSAFYLHDNTTKKILENIYNNWDQLIIIGQPYYDDHVDGRNYIFPGRRRYESNGANDAWNDIDALSRSLYMELKCLIQNLKEKFPEIDINETNKEARKDIVRSRPQHS